MKVCPEGLCIDKLTPFHYSGTTEIFANIFHALWLCYACHGVCFIDLLWEFVYYSCTLHFILYWYEERYIVYIYRNWLSFGSHHCGLHPARSSDKERPFKDCQDSHRKYTFLVKIRLWHSKVWLMYNTMTMDNIHNIQLNSQRQPFIILLQGNTDIAAAAAVASSSQPSLLACGSFGDGISSVHLMMKKNIFVTVRKQTNAIPLLFAMYIIFNLSYEPGA